MTLPINVKEILVEFQAANHIVLDGFEEKTTTNKQVKQLKVFLVSCIFCRKVLKNYSSKAKNYFD